MTKGNEIRAGVLRAMISENLSQELAATRFYVSSRSIQRWARKERITGNFMATRKRLGIAGIVSIDHQDILMIIAKEHPELYYPELSDWLELITGFQYSARQVRQVFYRRRYRYRVINEFRPLAQDQEYFAFYRKI